MAYDYEPNLALQCISPRSIYITVAIIYDRTVAGEDERAAVCSAELLERLLQSGYVPYRLGSQSMTRLPPARDDSGIPAAHAKTDPRSKQYLGARTL